MLILNADDWGRSPRETDATLFCVKNGAVTSASAMVFMEDSQRAAELAIAEGIVLGLHLNFTERFTDPSIPPEVMMAQQRIARYLKISKYASLIYNPALNSDFRLVYEAQVQEFNRLYGSPFRKIDGHQHMHLCTNMLVQQLLPKGVKVRRNFSFSPGEKIWVNRLYRKVIDGFLKKNFGICDYFFCFGQCLTPEKLIRIVDLGKIASVELMTHPIRPRESQFMQSSTWLDATRNVEIGSYEQL